MYLIIYDVILVFRHDNSYHLTFYFSFNLRDLLETLVLMAPKSWLVFIPMKDLVFEVLYLF